MTALQLDIADHLTQHGVEAIRCYLQVLQGNNAGQEHDLAGDEILLGRDSACDIVVDNQAVSRRHARLVRQGDRYAVEDLKSHNHTYVNGTQISGPVLLSDNDQITLAGSVFVFRSREPAAPPAEPAGSAKEKTPDATIVVDSVDVQESRAAIKVRPEAKLQAILQITQSLGRTLDLEAVLTKMLEGLFTIFMPADRALVLLLEGEKLIPKAVKHRRGDDDSIQYSRTIVQKAIDDRQALLSKDVVDDDRFAPTASIMDAQIHSIMCVPLLSQEGDVLGVIQLDSQRQGAAFDSDDMHILTSVASQAAISIEYAQMHSQMLKQARLQKEMDVAKRVQHHFLPKTMPELAGYGFWAYYDAAGQIGGDFYDFLRLPDGRQAVLLGDISGKGVPAALAMAKVSSACKVALLSHPNDLGRAVADINNDTCESTVVGTFATLVLCVIDPQTHEVTVANAGHMSPMFRRADGTIDQPAGTDVSGVAVGIVEDFEYPTVSTTLGPGESVVLYSDGISEAMNSQHDQYTIERIADQLAAIQGGAVEIGQALLDDVRKHTAGYQQSDDISLVVFGRAAE